MSRLVSFVIFHHSSSAPPATAASASSTSSASTPWSKKNALSGRLPIAAYVVVSISANLPSGLLLGALLAEAAGVPVIFAAVSSTGYVMLQEFTDAARTLQWE